MFKKCFTDKIKNNNPICNFKGRNTFVKNQNFISMHKLKRHVIEIYKVHVFLKDAV